MAQRRAGVLATACVTLLLGACGPGEPDEPQDQPDAQHIEEQPDAGDKRPGGDDVQAQVPSPPRDVVAVAGDASATVSWLEPATNGGRAVTGYVVTASDGATYESAKTSLLVEGLTNKTAYTFKVVARNAIGESAPSAPSNEVVPYTVPGAVSEVVAEPGLGKATVSWHAPDDDGGSPVTGYVVTASNGTTREVSTTSVEYEGLTPGIGYSFTVAAVNAAGRGPWSPLSNVVTLFAAPGAPTDVLALPEGDKAVVSWWAPPSDGGSPITHYEVTASDGSKRQSTETTLAFDGLAFGVAHSFTVAAFNAYGGGPNSNRSNEVVLITVPGPPQNVVGVRGPRSVGLRWSPPLSNGGHAITKYDVYGSNGEVYSSTTEKLDVMGLTNGVAYTFTVHAVNSVGQGPASEPSQPTIPGTLPGAPRNLTVSHADGSVTLSWQPPEDDGGYPIQSYFLRQDITTLHPVTDTTLTLYATPTGTLNLTQNYLFDVVALNGVGMGPPSEGLRDVNVMVRPRPPASVSAVAGNGRVTVSWDAGWDGGGTLKGYRVTGSDGSTREAPASPLVVEGLVNGVSYSFTVTTLTEELGASDPSMPSNQVTPASPPQAPTAVTATATLGGAAVSWTAPDDDGGAPVHSYRVTPVPLPSGFTPVSTSSTSLRVDGLQVGSPVSFVVEAMNGVGMGPASLPSNQVVPAALPGPPLDIIARLDETDDRTIHVSWQPPSSDGFSEIVGYEVRTDVQEEPYQASSNELTLTELERSKFYVFSVRAKTIFGEGEWSATSNSVQVPDVPGLPPRVNAEQKSPGVVLVSWGQAPDNSSPIIEYEVRTSSGDTHVTSALEYQLTGLHGGTTYSFDIRARNAVGHGPWAKTNDVAVVTPPLVVTNVVADIHDTGLRVSWSAPAADGGRSITEYRVKLGEWARVVLPSSMTVDFPDLQEGAAFTASVAAVNEVGEGPSGSSEPVTYVDRQWAQWVVPATPDYTLVGDVVRDERTGLEWQRVAAPLAMTWSEAVSYCEGLSLGGASDWRLPTLIELSSLVDFSKSPTIDTTVFTGLPVAAPWEQPAARYWSATLFAPAPGAAWVRSFDSGSRPRTVLTEPQSVRCVR